MGCMERGAIIQTASMAGLLPIGAPPVYSMSKAADLHFARAVASQLGEDSPIRVRSLTLGFAQRDSGTWRGRIDESRGRKVEKS